MNPQESIFSGYGVYEGFGDMACPGGFMEAFPGAGFCVPTISTPTAHTCDPGMIEPWAGAGICVPVGGVTPSGAPPSVTPSGTPIFPGPCPNGTVGIPPNCFPLPTQGQGQQPGPGSVPIPVPIPGSTPTPAPSSAPAQASSSMPSWAIPAAVGVGLVALLAFATSGKRRATPNRRRRYRRR